MNQVLFKVLAAILLAFCVGLAVGPDAGIGGVTFVRIFGLGGQLFLNALSLVVVPLVSASIITGTARMGAEHSFGALGGKTFGFYILTTFLAVMVGLFVSLLVAPGVTEEGTLGIVSSHEGQAQLVEATKQSQRDGFDTVTQIFYRLIPSNIIAAAAQGQMLGLIGFCLLFGYFTSRIDSHAGGIILGFWKGIFQIMMSITKVVMKALPIGVFCLVAKVAATTGPESVKPVALFFGTVLLGLAIHMFIMLPYLLFFVGGVSPLQHFKAVWPALVTAFSTSSSAASLPIAIECVEKRAGVSNRICSFTLPLGSSINLTGSALYICVVVMFIGQAYGIDFHFATLATIVVMSMLMSMGLAGIPSASLVAIMVILQTLNLPAEGIGLILAVERILDMFRTTVNLFGNTCCAVLVARKEGERDVLREALKPV